MRCGWGGKNCVEVSTHHLRRLGVQIQGLLVPQGDAPSRVEAEHQPQGGEDLPGTVGPEEARDLSRADLGKLRSSTATVLP